MATCRGGIRELTSLRLMSGQVVPKSTRMGKVRGASLQGGNLRGVVRGMWLLVSNFP